MKKIFLLLVILLATGCGAFGGGSESIDVPKRMSQIQQQGCQPAAVYEKTEESEYIKSHEFAMACK